MQDVLLDVRLPLVSKFGRLGRVVVAGPSMEPAFMDGDWLLVVWGARARISDAVVIEREFQPGVFLVKRIIKIEDGKYWVEGDNKVHSNDSRKWGSINGKEILARVIFRIRKGASE